MKKRFSIIVPVLHEVGRINDLIAGLRALEAADESEIIVVDGSAEGDTLAAIRDDGRVRTLKSPPGRALQMNVGAAQAEGPVIIFLHADTDLPGDALARIGRVMDGQTCVAGAFNLAIDSPRLIYRFIAGGASLRSRLTRIPYGDQAIFIRKEAFLRLGGYPDIPVLEDVALMRRLKKAGANICIIPECVTTSPRRWEREGPLYTTLRNRFLIAAYLLGVSPKRLSRFYKKRGGDDGPMAARSVDCILFFVKSPKHVEVKSRLAEDIGKEEARLLYRNFVLDMLDTLSGVTAKGLYDLEVCFYPTEAAADLRKWLGDDYSYRPQRGNDLGERMKNAFLEIFAGGYRRALLMGSDAPDLTGEIIAEGFDRLEQSGAVIGPACDGGYYLIGFQSRAFLPSIFEGISWGAGEVFQETMGIFRRENCDVSTLPLWRDIDTPADLQYLKERHRSGGFSGSRTMRHLMSTLLTPGLPSRKTLPRPCSRSSGRPS